MYRYKPIEVLMRAPTDPLVVRTPSSMEALRALEVWLEIFVQWSYSVDPSAALVFIVVKTLPEKVRVAVDVTPAVVTNVNLLVVEL